MQGVYWLLTIPHHDFLPYLPPGITFLKGQLERGDNTGYVHWQLLAVCSRSRRLGWIKDTFGASAHAELTRSAAADDYVWKDATAIANTRFSLGEKPFKRNNKHDWDRIFELARTGIQPCQFYVKYN